MLPGTLPFHLLLIAAVAMAWRIGRARPLAVATVGGLAASTLALVLGGGSFGAMRLLAWGIFGHAPVVALLLARHHWRAGARRLATALGAVAAVLLAVAVDAFLVEPRWLEVTTYRIAAPGLSRPLRVALVADIQTDRVGAFEREALGRLAAARPDLVVVAGDYVQTADPARRTAERVALRETWRDAGIAPRLGTVAVQGNTDPPGWEAIFAGLPVVATSTTQRLRLGEVTVTALAFDHSFDTALRLPPAPGFHIVVGHAPDFALSDGVPAQLLLAGHVHGGQVRLPFVGPLLTLSAVPRQHAVGRSELAPGRTLIVSRGLGMERATAPRLRFLCRPELVLIDLVPAPSPATAQPPGAPAARSSSTLSGEPLAAAQARAD